MSLPQPKSLCHYTPAPRSTLKERLQDEISSAAADYFAPAVAFVKAIPAPSLWYRARAVMCWSEADRLRAHYKVLEHNVAVNKDAYERSVRELRGCDYAIGENERRATRFEILLKGLIA